MNAAASGFSSTAARAAVKFVLVLTAAVVVAELLRVSAIAGLRVPLDPNEGWNAYHAADAMAGRALYPGPASFFVNNYPPLSFYLVGSLGRLLGDNIVAGRILSLLSFVFAMLAIRQVGRAMGCSSAAAAAGGAFFAAWLLLTSDYVGMNDPQLLGHALDLAALWVLLRDPRATLSPALLFVLAAFVKHNLVAMPLAVAAWFIVYDRRRAFEFVAAGVVLSLAGLLLFRLAYGSSLFSHLASARLYGWDRVRSGLGNWLVWGAVPTAIAAASAVARLRDRYVVLCTLYAGIALLFGIILSGGAGVDANVFFDADIALCLGVALALDRSAMTASWRAGAVACALVVPLVSGFYLSSDGEWRNAGFWLHPMSDDLATARKNVDFLRAHNGRALCETLSLCYWAGKREEVDVFNAGQEFATGARKDDALIRAIQAREFAAIEFDTLDPFALTSRIRRALLYSYRVDHIDDGGVFLVPKPAA